MSQRSLTEWSDVFEWFWDLSEWKLTKVVHNWLFGELHEGLLGNNATNSKDGN